MCEPTNIYSADASIHDAICFRDYAKVCELVTNGSDINLKKQTYTPLWCAICGMMSRPKEPTGLSDPRMVQLLLKNGADPNMKCMFIPPIYLAAQEGSNDIVVDLILHGADPNDYAMLKCEADKQLNKKVALCCTPIVVAVTQFEPYVVEALIEHGAVYNISLINYAKQNLEKLEKHRRESYDDKIFYKNAKRIVRYLNMCYDKSMDQKVRDLKTKHPKTGNLQNHYIGFGPLILNTN